MRRCGLVVVLAGLLAAAPVAKIAGPSAVPSGGNIVLDARQSVSDQPLKWKLSGPDVPLLIATPEDAPAKSLLLAFAPPDGVYRFTLIAVGTPTGEPITADADIFTVTVGGGSPAPVPPPDDRPKPPPVPVPAIVTGPLHVAVLYKLDMAEPDLTDVRIGAAIHGAEASLGYQYRVYADTDPALDAANLRRVAEGAPGTPGVGYPALVIYDASKVYVREPCPTDPAAIVAKVKALRGAR